jgi:hypothetical protein
MSDEEPTEEERAYAHARDRAQGARYGIAAAFLRNVAAHEDGWRGVVAISDGDQVIEVLVAVRSEVPLGPGSVRPAVVAGLVEEMVGDHAVDDRLTAMQSATSAGPGLRLDERFPELWRGAFD